ncbi:MAG: hypothetical protein ACE5F1_02650 [Planctomycetota bacterium]
MRAIHATILSLLLPGSGCYTVENVGLAGYQAATGLEFSRAEAPEGAEPISFLSVYVSGFYLLGFIPVAPATLEGAMERLVAEASDLGADGVSNIHYELMPPSPIKFSTFPIPDWSATVWLAGMAYRRQ